jgi:hypothetical protein
MNLCALKQILIKNLILFYACKEPVFSLYRSTGLGSLVRVLFSEVSSKPQADLIMI